ncbi:potassium channel family protein [[Limnothrix rosea] IAM M-220]|uniref:potassium channel family protein n=1 Tax=[Limnothrix rosea] IAM M-220 TaxID=454133 RepID=UPI00095F4203|nr:NAD(P)-binding protein [[Limnothrix rosea] IAM M-220]OKH18225.1 potassium channel protein [[Limnothrix rosea] IAM M-220]
MQPRIIICGLGRTGYRIFRLLSQQGAEVIGISDRPMSLNSQAVVIGDPRQAATLIHAGIREAQTLVLAHNDDALNLGVLTQARVLNPHIRIINRLYNQTLGDRLDQTLPEHVSMSVSALAAPIFAFAALGSKAIGQLNLYKKTWPIREEVIDRDHPWLGHSLSEFWENSERMLIHYLPAGGEEDLVSAVVTGKRLQVGDHLILGTPPRVKSKRGSFFRKVFKAIANLRQYQHHVRPMTLVILALLVTICLATFTYVFVNFDLSVVDALYFSVGMITGAGGKEEVAELAPDWVKLFTAMMMVVGAGVIGICYALINDFILGSRIRQFWDATKIPNQNHFVICGLGGMGMAIARQLHQQGHDVVVLENNHKNRFLRSARALGIPVIIADASVGNSLRDTYINRAEALIAATSEDMTNVEIALSAKAIRNDLSVIVRIQDANFAQSAQEVFDFDLVLSPTELSTHSFAAAALGGRILGNGMTDDLLWVALATSITPIHPFCGQTVRDAAIAVNFVPLYAESDGHNIHGWGLLDHQLQSGDVLYLTIAANGLQKLWRRNNNDGDGVSVEPTVNNSNVKTIEAFIPQSS